MESFEERDYFKLKINQNSVTLLLHFYNLLIEKLIYDIKIKIRDNFKSY